MPIATTAHGKALYKPQKAGDRHTRVPGEAASTQMDPTPLARHPTALEPRDGPPRTCQSPTARPARVRRRRDRPTHRAADRKTPAPSSPTSTEGVRPLWNDRLTIEYPQPDARQNRARLICAHFT